MSKFVSDARFAISDLDLNWYDRNYDDSFLDRSANISFNGVVYPDAFYVDSSDAFDALELTLLGTSFSGSDDKLTGGTVNLLGEYDLNADRTWWYAEGIALSATAVQEAAFTESTSDDLSLLAQALAGDDTIVLSPFDDDMSGFAGDDVITGGAGADRLTGGGGNDLFLDTAAGLSGDTITDFSAGDRIRISDAAPGGFNAVLVGDILTYTGGSVTLENLSPRAQVHIMASAGGGIELALTTTVNNMLNGDFNGDGRDDVLWRQDAGVVSNWLGQPDGGLANNDANARIEVPTDWKIVGAGDFNGDGRDDVLWRNDNGLLSDWLGQVNGGFVANDANALTEVSNIWEVAGVGDFNGDGRDDIAWRASDGEFSNWLGQANGGFMENNTNAAAQVSNDWSIVGVADFNGDGRDDVLWRNDNGQLSDWLGQADGDLVANDANALASVPTSWNVVGTGDFNGDGRDDILWRNDDGALSNWLGEADGGFSVNDANAFQQVSADWQVAGTGDYDGDGRTDILWRNDSGTVSNWLADADGGFTANDAAAAVNVTNDWQVQMASNYI